MKYLICFLLLLSHQFIIGQTAVIGKKINGAIYVGADSRMVTIRANQNNTKITTDTSSVCKIFMYKNYGFAVIGAGTEAGVEYAKKMCQDTMRFERRPS